MGASWEWEMKCGVVCMRLYPTSKHQPTFLSHLIAFPSNNPLPGFSLVYCSPVSLFRFPIKVMHSLLPMSLLPPLKANKQLPFNLLKKIAVNWTIASESWCSLQVKINIWPFSPSSSSVFYRYLIMSELNICLSKTTDANLTLTLNLPSVVAFSLSDYVYVCLGIHMCISTYDCSLVRENSK